jgi:hypothetical protein
VTQTKPTTTAQARYEVLRGDRQSFVDRARRCASLTIPSLFPPEGSEGDTLDKPYHSVGARGVNNLASKLTLAILPPGSSFFRLKLAPEIVEQLEAQATPAGTDEVGAPVAAPEGDLKGQLEQGLTRAETRVTEAVESAGSRIVVYESLRQLIAAGNVLVHVRKGGAMRFFRLDSYVVVRDGIGNVLEIVVKETLDRQTVPDKVEAILQTKRTESAAEAGEETEVDLYTRIVRRNGRYEEWQEVEDMIVPGTEGKYPLDRCPWMALRFMRLPGEHYGRSYAEELEGDLSSLNEMARALVDFAAIASRIVYLVKEGGITNIQDLIDAVSGDAIHGDKDEVGVLQLDKYADFQVTANTAQSIEGRLSAAFLLNTAVQRQAERVTAEEIRYVANELEAALGGIYSILAQEFQYPLANILMAQLARENAFPKLPKGSVKTTIVTGLEALGRSSDLTRIDVLIAGIGQTFGPEAVAQYIDIGAYIRRRCAALGIDPKGLVRTNEEVTAANQQRTQAELVGKLGPEAMRQQAAMEAAQNPQETASAPA